MAFFDPQPVNAGSSTGFSFTCQLRLPDPFTESNLTWTEVVASTSEAWGGFSITTVWTSGQGMIHVAIGSASNETIIATVPLAVDYRKTVPIFVPIPVPAGTRISVASVATSTYTIQGQVIGCAASGFDSLPAFTRMDCGPFDLDGGFGVWGDGPVVDPGAVANTKGSYTELSLSGTNTVANNLINGDSLARDYDWIGFLPHNNINSALAATYNHLIDIATGAASSETIILPDVYQYNDTGESHILGQPFWMPTGALAGTRFSMRAQCDNVTDATDRLISCTIFGLR